MGFEIIYTILTFIKELEVAPNKERKITLRNSKEEKEKLAGEG